MKIQDVKQGDYVTFSFRGNNAIVQTTDDEGSFRESVGLWLDEADKSDPYVCHQEENNLYTLQMYEDIESTLHESSGNDIYVYEKNLTLFIQQKPRLSERQEFKVIGHIDLDKIPTSTRPVKAGDCSTSHSDLQRQATYGINGYHPDEMEAVIFTKQFAGKSTANKGVAICKDENHFYVAFNLYTTDRGDYITIMDEHPEGLEPGLFPRGTSLKEITDSMAVEKMFAQSLINIYQKDIEAYKALEEQRRLEEERKKEEEEKRKQEEEERARVESLISDTAPDVPESLYMNVYGTYMPTLDYPFVENVSFQSLLAGLHLYYCSIQYHPIIYSLSMAYKRQTTFSYMKNALTWNEIKSYASSSCCICYDNNQEKHHIAIAYYRRDDNLTFSVLYNEHLKYAFRLMFSGNPDEPARPEDFVVRSSFHTDPQNPDIKNGFLERILAFITLENANKMRIYNGFGVCNDFTQKEKREKAITEWQEPQNGYKYVRRTVSSMKVRPIEKEELTEDMTDDEEIKTTHVESYKQRKWVRVAGMEALQPVIRSVSAHDKKYAIKK